MLVDKSSYSDGDYIALLLILNAAQEHGYSVKTSYIVENLKRLAPRYEAIYTLDKLRWGNLVYFTSKRGKHVSDVALDGYVGLTWEGLAFLINYANEFIELIRKHYDDVPEKLVTSLLRYIDLNAVPAADRYVDVTDNLPQFQKLTRELEIIRDAILRDQNANELPIPNKREALSDIEGLLAQIKNGTVRLSDLAGRIRPMIKNLAELCKDFVVIAGAASAAYLAIGQILEKLH